MDIADTYNFFAFISRMKYIHRWPLMRNTHKEDLSQHSYEVSVIAHALTVISNTRFGTSWNAERAALIGLYHDVSEILTGDMPTPVKYFNPEIQNAFQRVEKIATQKLLDMLPSEMKPQYNYVLFPTQEDEYLWKIVKAADKISALIKCIEEEKASNTEFKNAAASLRQVLQDKHMPEVDVFLAEFLPAYSLTLDQLR